MEVVIDIETNKLISPDIIWIAVCRELASGEVKVFERPDKNPEFREYSKSVTKWIGHNLIAFDIPVLHSLIAGLSIDPSSVVDTYVVSSTVSYQLEGGHSLDNWGRRLGVPKVGADITDWSVYTDLIKQRCIADTLINLKLYQYLLKYINSDMFIKALDTEHQMAWICNDLHTNGFSLDIPKVNSLLDQLNNKLKDIDDVLVSSFNKEISVIKSFIPKVTKEGTLNQQDFRFIPIDTSSNIRGRDLSWFEVGKRYFVLSVESFNPGSIKQCIRRLNEAGWKPTEKTKGHLNALKRGSGSTPEQIRKYKAEGWTLSETNLSSLPETAPEGAKRLAERLLIASRISDLEEWLKAVSEDGKAHGEFRHIGAWTHRMSHRKPNLANISRPFSIKKQILSPVELLKKEYDEQMRSVWIASKDRVLVGTDAVGIQMRIFAHHVNSKELIDTLISGEDIHRLNMKALGDICRSRDDAKTFIYAFLLGAGFGKISEILGCTLGEAIKAKENFLSYYPGLGYLLEEVVPKDFARGYLIGLDGRPILCDTEHKVLAGYLQSGEAIIMKMACILWRKELRKLGVPFWQVNFVHDEWQTETLNMELAQIISKVQIDSLRKIGEQLNLNIPMDGDSKFGKTWRETH